MAEIILHNSLITVHNGAELVVAGMPKDVTQAHLAQDIIYPDTLLYTVEDVSTWSIGDTIVFVPQKNHNSTLASREIVSIVDDHIIQFNISLPFDYVRSQLPTDIPPVSNVTKDIKIRGAGKYSRAGIRALDTAKLDFQHIEFKYWGVRSVASNGIVLLTDKTHDVNVDQCALNNDGETTTGFVTIYKDTIRRDIPNINFTNNIVFNTGGIAIDARPGAPLSSFLNIHDNLFIKGSVYVSSISATELNVVDNIYYSCSIPATYADCTNIITPIFDNSVYYANRNIGLNVINTTNTVFQNISGTYNVGAGVNLQNANNITARDIMSNYNNAAGINIANANSGVLIYNIYAAYNNLDNICVDTAATASLLFPAIVRNSFLANSTTKSGVTYAGAMPFRATQLTAINNTDTGINTAYTTTAIVSGLSVYNNNVTGNYAGISLNFANNIYIRPNEVFIDNNIINKNSIGTRGNNIYGLLTNNFLSGNILKDFDVTVGNDSTLFSNNTSILNLNNLNYTFLNIGGGVNYKDILVQDNILQATNVNIIQGGITVCNYEMVSVIDAWPETGITLAVGGGTGANALLTPFRSNECIIGYISDPDIKFLKIFYTGDFAVKNKCILTVSINDNAPTIISKASPTVIKLLPKDSVGRKFTKIIVSYTGGADVVLRGVNIDNIQFSHDGTNFSDIDPANFYFNSSITYPNDTNPATVLPGLTYNKSLATYIAVGNTNFKNFKAYNNSNISFVDMNFKMSAGLVAGSYLLDNNYVSVDAASVFKYYQPHVEKTVGVSNIIYPNASTHYKNGYILSDTSISDTNEQNNAPSECIFPNTTYLNKLKSGKKYVAVTRYSSVTVYVFAKKSKAYKGNNPRLMVSKNTVLGILEDAVLAVHDIDTHGWVLLKGTTEAVTKDGVLEFYVDCDGITGFIALDSWASPVNAEIPSVSPSTTPSFTPTPTNTSSFTPTPTNTPSFTPTPSNTPSFTPTFTPTPTTTPTNTPSFTPTRLLATPTRTPTTTRTPQLTVTPTRTGLPISSTPTNTPTCTITPSNTPSFTPTPSNTPSFTPTTTNTPSFTPTNTSTPSFTPTNTNTPSVTPTNTLTPTTTPSSTRVDAAFTIDSATSTLLRGGLPYTGVCSSEGCVSVTQNRDALYIDGFLAQGIIDGKLYIDGYIVNGASSVGFFADGTIAAPPIVGAAYQAIDTKYFYSYDNTGTPVLSAKGFAYTTTGNNVTIEIGFPTNSQIPMPPLSADLTLQGYDTINQNITGTVELLVNANNMSQVNVTGIVQTIDYR